MATSGRVESGTANFTKFYFQWQWVSYNIAGNYTTINWQWGVSKSGGSTATWYSNAIKSVSGYIDGGLAFGGNTWSNITVGGDVQLLNGSWNIYHNSDGTKSFGISSTGWLYGYGNLGNSGSWALPTIPRHASITGATGDLTDSATTASITFSNPAGTAVDTYLELPSYSHTTTAHLFSQSSPSTHTLNSTFWNDVYATMTAVNSTTLRYVVHDSLGGDNWSYYDYTVSIANANPTFSAFTYLDSNSTTTAITGNNQYLIQGQSNLQVTVSSGNKGVAVKGATMDHYTVNIGGYSQNLAYSTSTVMKDVGAVSDVTGSKTISVTAVDSRGNSTLATASTTVLPYSAPVVTATAGRANGYDDAVVLTVAGSISPLTISSVDKNGIKSATTSTANKVEWRYATDGGSYGAWSDLSATVTSGTGAVAGGSTVTVAASGTASASHSYQIQVKITDKIGSTTQTVNVPVGKAIFRIGIDGYVYNQENRIAVSNGWTPMGGVSAVTYNGNRSYTLTTVNDETGNVNPGDRIRTTRGTSVPTQVSTFNGTNNSLSKSSPAGMTGTNNYTWIQKIKPTAYPNPEGTIQSYMNVTGAMSDGWKVTVKDTGRINLCIRNNGNANYRVIQTRASLPLNEFTEVAITYTSGTALVYFNGVNQLLDTAATNGTAPTVWTNNGTSAYVIGRSNATEDQPFTGEICQVAVFNAVLSQSTIRNYYSQSLVGTETNLISAYTLSNSLTDLNTTNANNLTNNNSTVITTADAPWGTQANSTISSTLDYGIVQTVASSTMVVQVPEGCTIDTRGTIASVSTSPVSSPFGFPKQKRRWRIRDIIMVPEDISIGALYNFYVAQGASLLVPIGEWEIGYSGVIWFSSTVSGTRSGWFTLNPTAPAAISSGQPPKLALNLWTRLLDYSTTDVERTNTVSDFIALTSETRYYSFGAVDVTTGSEAYHIGHQGPLTVFAINAYL